MFYIYTGIAFIVIAQMFGHMLLTLKDSGFKPKHKFPKFLGLMLSVSFGSLCVVAMNMVTNPISMAALLYLFILALITFFVMMGKYLVRKPVASHD